ncbi:Rieske (2Fe-2S) protein [Propionibacteriaceae bacterium G1746]
MSDVPSGGAVILKGKGFVVAQPTAGEFKAFDAICTHQGCEVSNIDGADIVCGCHGSRFKVADGSVVTGPAPTGLAAAKVTRDGDTLTVTEA